MAAKIARGKYLVFLNNDTNVTPNWLEQLIMPLEKDKTIALAQSLLLRKNNTVDSSGDFIDTIGRTYSNQDSPNKEKYILSPKGACMIARRDLFLELGGFDESYFASFEDVEIGWKSWLYGYKVVVIPSSVVYHYGGKTIEHLSDEIAFHGVKNNIALRLTHMDFFQAVKSFILIGFIVVSEKLFKTSYYKTDYRKYNIPKFSILIKSSFWVLKNLGKIIKKRKEINSKKIRTNNELKKMGLITEIKI